MKILKVYKPAFNSKKRYIVLRGGAGSGKSVFATQKILSRLLNETPHKFLVLRKVGATIKNSVFALFKDIINSENLQNLFVINKSDFTITCKINGNQVIFSGLDDSEKIKSIAGITGVWLEEASEFTFDEWSQIQLRVRGQHKHYVQFILTFNPISEESWLKTEMWDKDDDDVYKLVTTYKDNCFLSKVDLKHFEERVQKNAQYWRVYGCGLWGTIQTGGEMVHQFDYNKHVANVFYNPQLPLHISVDFNILPHCSMAIFQIENGVNINIIDEIALEHPHNRTKDMCQEFCRLYSGHKTGVFVYGDVAGQHSDTRSEAGHNDYTIIMRELIKFKPQLRLGTKAPSVVMSTSFLNSIFDNNEKIKLRIDFSCKKIINDMLYLKQNAEGGKLIEYEKHPQTGTRYEKYGHMFDCLEGNTLVTTINGDVKIKDIKIGDYVLTRKGYKKITYTINKGFKKVNKYNFSNGSYLISTPNHKIWTENKDFFEISLIKSDTFCILDKNKNICKKKLSITTDVNLQGIPNQKTEVKDVILADGLKSMEKKKRKDYIGINTLLKWEKLNKQNIFIILMEIHLIMKSQILNAKIKENILVNIQKNIMQICQKKKEKLEINSLIILLKNLENIISQKLAKKKEKNILKNLQKNLQEFVNYVEKNIQEKKLSTHQKQYIAQTNVQTEIEQTEEEKVELITKQGFVKFAENHLNVINIQNKELAEKFVGENCYEEVYDIEVEDEHEFFANGILVHNCTRYYLTTCFSREYQEFQTGAKPFAKLRMGTKTSAKNGY